MDELLRLTFTVKKSITISIVFFEKSLNLGIIESFDSFEKHLSFIQILKAITDDFYCDQN